MCNHLLCKDLVHYPIETTICIINGWSSGSKNDGFYVMDKNLLVIVEEVVIRVGGRWATYLCLVHGWCWPEARPSWDDCCLLFADFILRWLDMGLFMIFPIPGFLPQILIHIFEVQFQSDCSMKTLKASAKHGKLCQGRLWATWSLTRSCLRVINEKLDGQIGMMMMQYSTCSKRPKHLDNFYIITLAV